MELQLEQQHIPCLIPCAQRSTEEQFSTDAVVPDSLPDAAELLLTEGDLCLWRLDLSDGSAELEGEIDARVCCADEAGCLMSIPVRVPVQLRLRSESISSGQRPFIRCRIKKLSGHLLNSRKVRVQASVYCSLVTYGVSEMTVTTGIESEDQKLYLRKSKMTFPYLSAVEERVITTEDTVSLQRGVPSGGRMISYDSVPIADVCECCDQRVTVKGSIRTSLLYQDSESQSLITEKIDTPFSCVLDIDGAVSSFKLSIHLTSTDVRCRNDDPAVDTAFHLLIQAICFAEQELEYITDAYSNRAELSLEWEEQSFPVHNTAKTEQCVLEEEVPYDLSGKSVCTVRTSLQADGVAVSMLFLDSGQKYSSVSCYLKTDQTIERIEEPSVEPGKNGLMVRAPVMLMEETDQHGSVRVLSAADLQENRMEIRSGVTFVRREEATDLWELAKMNQSSVDAIRSANPELDQHYKWFVIPHVQ